MAVIGHGAFLVAASGTSGAAHTGRQARTGARSISRGERDAHGALPKRLHAVRPLDRHIARSLTIAILDEAGVNHWAHGLPGKVSPEEARWFVWGPWEFNTGASAQVTDKQDHPAAVILQAGRQELGPARPDTYPAGPLDGVDDPGAVAAPASRAGPVADHLRARWRAVDPAPRGPGSRAATGAGKVTIVPGHIPGVRRFRRSCWTCRQFTAPVDAAGLAFPQLSCRGNHIGVSQADPRNRVSNPVESPVIVSLLRDS